MMKLLVHRRPAGQGAGFAWPPSTTRPPIERSNGELREALSSLEASRAQIEAQNQELINLATRDALTGLLNRRAFFSTAEKPLRPRQRARRRAGGDDAGRGPFQVLQ